MSMPVIAVPEGLETNMFLLAPGALDHLPELIRTAFPGKIPWLIADENTWQVAGIRAKALLNASGLPLIPEYIFPGTPKLHPEFAYSEMLAGKMEENCVPVAVGSGVINDLVKCASGIKGVRYCCVPTACSVDGYTSSGAALSVKGTKQTVPCPAPYALCADVEILKTAPSPMMASGYADLLTKIPAGADWIIADELGEDPIRSDVWALIQDKMRGYVADSNDLLNIFAGLAATGYAMQMMKDSRPASGAEHLCSHVWEMEGLTFEGEDVSHGFKVGVGLLASTLLHEFILEHSFEELVPRMKVGLTVAEREEEIAKLMERGCYGEAPKKTAMAKFLTGDALEKRRAQIGACWTRLQERLRKQMIPFKDLVEMLKKAACPVTPSGIGLDAAQFVHGVRMAQLIRTRYTVLDLLYDLGLLDVAIEEKLFTIAEK